MGTKKLKASILAVLLLYSGCFIGMPQSVKALSGLSFTPAFLRIDVPAGHTIEDDAVVVKNNSTVAVHLHAAAMDVDTTSSTLIPLTTSKSAATKAVQVRNPDLTLQPGQSANVLIRVDATKLSAGGQFTSVEIRQIADVSKQGLPINQAASIGMFIVKEQGAIRTLRLKVQLPRGVITTVPKIIPLSFYADGNVGLVPRAAITVNEGDTVIAKTTINETSVTVQPQTSLDFKPALTYLSPISPGRHVISISYRYDGQEDPLIVQSTFWYIPIWYLLIVALGIAALIVLWWRHRQQPLPEKAAESTPQNETIATEFVSKPAPKTKKKTVKKATPKKRPAKKAVPKKKKTKKTTK